MIKNVFLLFILLSTFCIVSFSHVGCVHDHYTKQHKKHYFNDLQEKRFLQQAITGKIRIFADYTQLTAGGPTQINMIKRIVNITASYFYNTLNVTRLQKLFFPSNVSRSCNSLTVPQIYVTNGTIGDLGVIIGNQENYDVEYVAKASACALLNSTNRPIWGSIMFNNVNLQFNQIGFQKNLFVGIHEMTHILGFSVAMFSLYPKGNPLVQMPNGDNYASSEAIIRQAQDHYGCNSTKGLLLEDQDGSLIGSHWERKLVGEEFITASAKYHSYISRFTLALLESTGWYSSVNYTFAQSSTWGKNKGCSFFNIDNCDSNQFCSGKNFECDWTGNTIGRCSVDPFTGSCSIIRYFTQTICIDESFELKNLNAILNANERGGSNSKCFNSNYKSLRNLKSTTLNNRCYISVCSANGKYIFILIGQSVLTCRVPGQRIGAPIGLQGNLTCPGNFDNYCKSKPTCPYHCNKNGACINGQCLCTGNKQLTPTCIDISIFDAPIGSTGGYLQSIKEQDEGLILTNQGISQISSTKVKPVIIKYSSNKKCVTGTVFDQIFGECLKCKEVYNCQNCDQSGCYKCDNGSAPTGGKC